MSWTVNDTTERRTPPKFETTLTDCQAGVWSQNEYHQLNPKQAINQWREIASERRKFKRLDEIDQGSEVYERNVAHRSQCREEPIVSRLSL
jgi:hypothetical protein